MNSSFKKTALASVVAGTLSVAAIPVAQADVLNVSWSGAFTMLNATGAAFLSSGSDYAAGIYANGDGGVTYGAPAYPGNVGPGAIASTVYAGAFYTANGWKGNRTPVSGTMAFDLTSGAGVGTVNDFFFFGDTAGSGTGTHVARALGISFQTVDFSAGTIIGTMLFSWNGGGHSVSIVLDGSGMFANLSTFMAGGPTNTMSGVGALPATNGFDFLSGPGTKFYPLGPAPVATKTWNTRPNSDGPGCDGVPIATQTNAYTIVGIPATIGACTGTGLTVDTVGGDPMASGAFGDHNANFDITSLHFDSFVPTPTAAIPVPAAVWLFGSGLLGLVGIARRKKKA